MQVFDQKCNSLHKKADHWPKKEAFDQKKLMNEDYLLLKPMS